MTGQSHLGPTVDIPGVLRAAQGENVHYTTIIVKKSKTVNFAVTTLML